MSWRKYFSSVDNSGLPLNVTGQRNSEGGPGAATSRYASWLPEVYAGSPNRLMRYIQYDQMDNDLEINAALDTIGEFGTQEDDSTGLPFKVEYNSLPTDTENKIINSIINLKNKPTIIMIAHKYNTLLNCNRIIQIEDGRIVKQGSPRDIINSLPKEFNLY